MIRRSTAQRSDWLRPKSFGIPVDTLLPAISEPSRADLIRSTVASMALGALCGVAILMAIIS